MALAVGILLAALGAVARLCARRRRDRVTVTVRWHQEHSVSSPGSRKGLLTRTSKPDP